MAQFITIKTKAFPLFKPQSHFTDDTVLTIAIAEAFYQEIPSRNYPRISG